MSVRAVGIWPFLDGLSHLLQVDMASVICLSAGRNGL